MAMCPVCFSPITFLYSCCLKLLQRRALVWIFLLSNQQVSISSSPSQGSVLWLCLINWNVGKTGKGISYISPSLPTFSFSLSHFFHSSLFFLLSLLPSPLLCLSCFLLSTCPSLKKWYLFVSFLCFQPARVRNQPERDKREKRCEIFLLIYLKIN